MGAGTGTRGGFTWTRTSVEATIHPDRVRPPTPPELTPLSPPPDAGAERAAARDAVTRE